jgi:hypothetical protein
MRVALQEYFAGLLDWVGHRDQVVSFLLTGNGQGPGMREVSSVAVGYLIADGSDALTGDGRQTFNDRGDFDPAMADDISLRLTLSEGFQAQNPFPPPATIESPALIFAALTLVTWGGSTINIGFEQSSIGLVGRHDRTAYRLALTRSSIPG